MASKEYLKASKSHLTPLSQKGEVRGSEARRPRERDGGIRPRRGGKTGAATEAEGSAPTEARPRPQGKPRPRDDRTAREAARSAAETDGEED